MKKTGLLWVLFCSAFTGFGQTNKASLDGLVLDAATRQPVASATVMGLAVDGRTLQSRSTAADGSFRLELTTREPFKVLVQARDYIPTEEMMDFSDSRVVRRTGKTFLLRRTTMTMPVATTAQSRTVAASTPPPATAKTPPPLTVTDKTVELRAIQFAQSTADMVPEAQTDLDRVLTFLTSNPTISIELAGHTDNQGDFDKNVALSRQRAEAVKTYLVSKGIAPNRIQTRGYGGTRPVATNNYEKSRQLNRRVDMRVLTP